MNKLKNTIYVIAVIIIFSAPSCTNLEETIYDKIPVDDFYQTEEQIITAMVPAYGDLRNLVSIRGTFTMGEYTTDEAVLPTRGSHWYDGGNFQRMHEHKWTSEDVYLNNGWNDQFQLVNRANMLIYQFGKLDNMNPDLKEAFTAELKCIRALGYYGLVDNYGNVPIIDRHDIIPGFQPENNTDFEIGRKNVFEFTENELVSNVEKVSAKKDNSTYGRMNKWAVYALMTKLYINAEVWTGTPRWDDAIACADKIIQSGQFILEPNYFSNFLAKNEGSKENIFVIPFDDFRTGNGWGSINTNTFYLASHHMLGTKIFITPSRPSNGGCALPSHYRSFDPKDLRLRGWSVGPQYDKITGEPLKMIEDGAPGILSYTIDFVKTPDDGLKYDHTNTRENFGARIVKYEISYASAVAMTNDFALFRYADILLLKAEALMRKNGGVATQPAVDLVNQVRKRAFAAADYIPLTTSTLTMDQLLKERSWELYFEGYRRQDLVRWGKFVRGTWEFYNRSNENDSRNVFPIPQSQINANQNLKQNPGY